MEEEIDKYVSYYSFTCEMCTEFEYYRAFCRCRRQQRISSKRKTYNASTCPIRCIYPALGRDFSESTTLNSIQALAETCQKCNNTLFRALNSRVTLDFVLEQLSHFFGNITNEINKNISYLTITSLNNIFFQITLISFKKLKVKS